MTTLEILREAREFMGVPGNCAPKAEFGGGEDGRVCLMAAFTRRNEHIAVDDRIVAFRLVERAVAEHLGEVPRIGLGFSFYDRPETTHADVVAVLDRAVEVEEAKGQEFTVEPLLELELVA